MGWKKGCVPANTVLSPLDVAKALVRKEAGESVASIARSFGVSREAIWYNWRIRGARTRVREMKTGVCRGCGKVYEYRASLAPKRPRLFCSIPCRTAHYRGRLHGNYTVTGFTTDAGYAMVNVPDGHSTRSLSGRKRNKAPEHVIIAERVLGRPLQADEVVHHLDGNKRNNVNSNLLVCTRQYHNALHSRMSYLYQREHFSTEAVA